MLASAATPRSQLYGEAARADRATLNSTTLADLFEVSSEGSPAMGTSIGRRASENGEHGAADRG